MASGDEVRLAVPATPDLLRLARMTAAGLASRLGFTFEQVEDLRLAIDELCFGITGSAGRDGMVILRYVLEEDAIVVEGRGAFDGHVDAAPQLSELSKVILDALVDEHQLGGDGSAPSFRLVKRRAALGS